MDTSTLRYVQLAVYSNDIIFCSKCTSSSGQVVHKAAVLLQQLTLYLATYLASVHFFHPSSCLSFSSFLLACFWVPHFLFAFRCPCWSHQAFILNPCLIHFRLLIHLLALCRSSGSWPSRWRNSWHGNKWRCVLYSVCWSSYHTLSI